MLKVISTKQVRLGMFIQELKGSWIDHPFWKGAFKLDSAVDLKKLQNSIIKEIVIDTSKGLDVENVSKITPTAPIQTPAKVLASSAKRMVNDKKNAFADIEDLDTLELGAIIDPPSLLAIENPSDAATLANPERQRAKISASAEREQAKRVINDSKKAVATMFDDARMGKAVSVGAAMQMVDDIAASVDRNLGALISLVRLKNKDEYTYMHSVAVCALMVALAKELGLSESEIRQAGLAGLLHDIGKAGIPSDVLNKPGALTDEEFSLVKLHPERGHQLLMQANILDEVVVDVCLHHHEKVNGMGYPHQLQADEISLFAKMGAVCDVYDAITSNRPYKAGWEPGISMQRMAQWEGHFDDTIFKAFVKSVGIYPIGSMVKLKSGRLAVVIDQSQKSLLMPLIKVFFSTKLNLRIKVELIDLSNPFEQDTIVGHEDPISWGIHDINEIWGQA
jgi:putative nucleotidyltransferase with HDIG domain